MKRVFAAALAMTLVVALLGLVRRVDALPEGLQASYFPTADWAMPPAISTIDVQPSTDALMAAWNGRPPQVFSATWTGSMIVLQEATYTFATRSDDGSWLYLDDTLIVDNGGNHAARTVAASVHLTRGVHPIQIKYFQAADQLALDLLWAHGDRPLYPVPSWALTPEQPTFWPFAAEVLVRWVLAMAEWLWVGTLIATILALAWPALAALGSFFRGREGRWLAAVLAASVLINVVSLSSGLDPETSWRGNELGPIDVFGGTLQFFSHGWMNPYPPLHFYLLTIVYSPLLLLEQLGQLSAWAAPWYNVLFLAGRLVSVVMSAGVLLAVYQSAAEAFSRRAGVFAAAALALVVPFVGYSKATNVDVPCLFWFAISLVFYLRLVRAPTLRDAVLFAVMGMLAVGTKDQAYALYLPAPFVLLYGVWRDRRRTGERLSLLRTLVDVRTLTAVVAAAATFALVNNLLFNFAGFAKRVEWLLGAGSQPFRIFQPTLAGRLQLLSLTARLDQQAWGWPLLLVSSVGIVVALASSKTRHTAVALLAIVIAYYVGLINIILYNYDRFLLPVCLVQALFAGLAFDRLLSGGPLPRWKPLLASAVLAYSVLYATTLDVLMLRDSRYFVGAWLRNHVDRGQTIGTIFQMRNRPNLDGLQTEEISDAEALTREAPAYYVIDADYAAAVPPDSSNWDLVKGLQHETLGYRLILRYRSPTPWPWNWLPDGHPDLVGPRLDGTVFSALHDVNPTFEVYKRVS